MARSVVEIEPSLPQRPARERVDILPARALGEARRGDGDMGLEHERVVPPHRRARRADGDGPRHVGGAVGILGAGVDEIERAWLELEIARGRRPVMHHGAMRSCRRDRIEAQILELSRVATELFELHRRADLIDPARGRMLVEPGEEARHRRAVADMRGAGARDLGVVLDRLGQNAGVVAGDDLGAGSFENLREAHRRRVRIEADARRLLAKRRKPSRQVHQAQEARRRP